MKISNISFSSYVLLLCLAMLTGCGSTGGVRADRAKVSGIQTVAVIGFAVPHNVTLPAEDKSSIGSGIGFLKNLVKDKGNLNKAAKEGNGAQIAPAALAGFTEEMAKGSRMKFMSTEEVVSNANYSALLASYDESKKLEGRKNGVTGLAVIQLEKDTDKLEFAQKAAATLGVDGVILVDVWKMNYEMYSGIGGGMFAAGSAQVVSNSTYQLFDKNGQSVWADQVFARSNVRAGIAGDEIQGDPTKLYTDAGTTIAAALKDDYQAWAKSAK